MPARQINIRTKLRVKPNVISRSVQDEEVILDLNAGKYYGLDIVGALVWRTAEEGKELAQAVRKIHAEFEADDGQVEADVVKLARDMVKAGLVEPV